MRIVHCSDIHFGSEIPELVEALTDRVGALAPDLIVASGDFTMAGRYREFRAAATLLKRMPAPIIATPGNHDLPVYNLLERFITPFRRYHRSISPLTLTEHLSPDAAILSLNSARRYDLSFNWSHGRLSDDQIERADRFFAKAHESRFRALVVHHPFFVPEDLPGFRTIGNGDAMLEVLAKHRVHAVLSGHLHQQSETTRELTVNAEDDEVIHTVTLLQVASATTTRRRDQPNAFNCLDLDDDHITLTEQVEHEGRFEPRNARVLRSIRLGPARVSMAAPASIDDAAQHETSLAGSR